jgi:hypothetical protein
VDWETVGEGDAMTTTRKDVVLLCMDSFVKGFTIEC